MRFLLLRTFFSSSKALHPTVVDWCSDRHFSLCPVVGGNSPRKFRPFFPRIKIPSWMHSELHFPAVNHPGVVIYRNAELFSMSSGRRKLASRIPSILSTH